MASFQEMNGVFIADTATVVGEVTLGEGCNIWFSSVVRGDVAPICLGRGVNVQDGSVLHCDAGKDLVIGDYVTIGHGAIVHNREVGEGTLIGMGARVLGGVRIGKRCLIAAGAVVPPNLVVPDEMMVVGVPGRIMRPITEDERAYLEHLPQHYMRLARRHTHAPDASTVRYGE